MAWRDCIAAGRVQLTRLIELWRRLAERPDEPPPTPPAWLAGNQLRPWMIAVCLVFWALCWLMAAVKGIGWTERVPLRAWVKELLR